MKCRNCGCEIIWMHDEERWQHVFSYDDDTNLCYKPEPDVGIE